MLNSTILSFTVLPFLAATLAVSSVKHSSLCTPGHKPNAPSLLHPNHTTILTGTPIAHPFCFPPSRDPHSKPHHLPILRLTDCGRAVHDLLSSPKSLEPQVWGPIRRDWYYGSCGISLIPVRPHFADYFSRGAIAAAALKVKSACVNEAHGYRGGEVAIGVYNAFVVAMFGVGD